MLDATIGELRNPTPRKTPAVHQVKSETQQGYAFAAMPMDADDHSLVDVLDTIKTAGRECGLQPSGLMTTSGASESR